jgi:hypothetical protein
VAGTRRRSRLLAVRLGLNVQQRAGAVLAGRRESRRAYLWPLAAFTAGLTVGALLTATLLWVASGLLAPLPGAWSRGLLVGGVTLLLLRDLGLVRFWLPENHRQVPQSVVRRPGLRPAFQFGAELGSGVRTYVPSASPYLLALAILLLPAPMVGALAAAGGFALGRAAMPATRLLSTDVGAWDGLLGRRLSWLVAGAAVLTALLVGALILGAG